MALGKEEIRRVIEGLEWKEGRWIRHISITDTKHDAYEVTVTYWVDVRPGNQESEVVTGAIIN